ncbi:MAG TPA: hypothetical protein VFU02_08935 [Polyangiaceae bacterium]|nr:hypothetical protein [Polyangiaceae bacterium]
MDLPTLVEGVRWSARFATGAFVVAVALPALTRAAGGSSARSWLVFLLLQTLHFGLVVRLAVLVDGVDMFPDGRSVDDAGGWPTVFAIIAVFYALGVPVLWRRLRAEAAGRVLRLTATGATLCLGLMLLATYVPLWGRSSWFVLPAVLVVAALVFELAALAQRRVRCLLRSG